MRPRIQRNLVASSNSDSRAAEMAAYNRREHNRLSCQSTSSIGESRPYTYILGVKVILGTSITIEDCKKASIKIYNL